MSSIFSCEEIIYHPVIIFSFRFLVRWLTNISVCNLSRNYTISLKIKQNKTTYNKPSHHFHTQDTEASLCINCHMTGKTYMGNDFRRGHSFRIPRPDQTVDYGTPNACNSCHTEKSAEWAVKAIKQNYGEERPLHSSDLLIPGQLGDQSALRKLIGDSRFPAIVRATAIRSLSSGPVHRQAWIS